MLALIEADTLSQPVPIEAFQWSLVSRDRPKTARESEHEHPNSDERELIASAQAGNTGAFAELIQRHYDACLRRAMQIVQNKSDAEDEVQNACWKAFQHLHQYRGGGSFPAWLARIVENQCLMRIRERRAARFLYLDKSDDSNLRLELVGQSRDPEDQLGERQVTTLVRREISRMPALLRQVLILREVEQLSVADVAFLLGISVPAAKSRLSRARIELRARIGKHCGRKGCATLTQNATYDRLAYQRAS